MPVAELTSVEELTPLVHTALRAWYVTEGADESLLDDLLLVQESRRARGGSERALNTTSQTALRLATNQVLLEGIEELEIQDQKGAQVLRLRFADDNTLMMVAHKLNVSEHTVSRIQRAAIGRLAEILFERETAAREARIQAIQAQMPPPSYTRLFGVQRIGQRLLDHLTAEDGPKVIAVVGMGGIGKTALADNAARRIAHQLLFESIIWLRLEPQTMSGRSLSPQLTFEGMVADLAAELAVAQDGSSAEQRLVQIRRVLKANPYLIIVDNLETDADAAYLIDHLNDLAGPSKFLLTTRTRPAPQATVFHFSVSELSREDALALMRHHAGDIGVELAHGADETSESDGSGLDAVFDVIGGNPLALKLAVSLLDLLPLPQILSDLARSRPGPIEELYRHIYWQAWRILSPEAKSLLQAMPLVSESGGAPDYLQQISELPADRFWPALQELRYRSLLEVRGTLQEKRYGVHRLTETFLRTEIIQWPEDDGEP